MALCNSHDEEQASSDDAGPRLPSANAAVAVCRRGLATHTAKRRGEADETVSAAASAEGAAARPPPYDDDLDVRVALSFWTP
jgi:hypothetical protein